jgi:hypothetical protein
VQISIFDNQFQVSTDEHYTFSLNKVVLCMFKKALYLLALQKLHTVDEHHRLQPSIVRASNHFAYHLGVPASKSPGPHGCAALHGWCEQTTANDWAAAAVEEMARTAASAKATTQAERRRGSDTGEEQNARGSFLRRFPPPASNFHFITM